ncbi:MAG: hypothetical protein GQ569_08765 [Methylococcaceae bacterium]|nr:hypothetical protein [Methylococcaceae bacterium]
MLTLLIALYLLSQTGWLLIPIVAIGIGLIYFYTSKITHSAILCLIAPRLAFGVLMIILGKQKSVWVYTTF